MAGLASRAGLTGPAREVDVAGAIGGWQTSREAVRQSYESLLNTLSEIGYEA